MVAFAEPSRLALLALPAAAVLLAAYRHRRRRAQQRRLASPGVWVRLLGGVPATGLARLVSWCGAAALIALFGSEGDGRIWLNTPNSDLDNTQPLELIEQGQGEIVAELLEDSLLGHPG